MKILTEDILPEYGFMDDPAKSSAKATVMTRDDFNVSIKFDGIYYTIQGIDYPLIDTSALRKHYKETKREELKPKE